MDYYNDLITDRSWKQLQKLQKKLNFVLIGGWATYLYSQTLKSKDIDIIIDFSTLGVIQKQYSLSKNDRLNKYEIHLEGIDVDIYLPHYSSLGIPIEDLLKNTTNIQGFTVLQLNYLFVLKLYTLSQRGRSSKGRKDFIDLLSLFTKTQVDIVKVKEIMVRYNLSDIISTFKQMLTENNAIPELELTQHGYAKVKKEIETEIKKGAYPLEKSGGPDIPACRQARHGNGSIFVIHDCDRGSIFLDSRLRGNDKGARE